MGAAAWQLCERRKGFRRSRWWKASASVSIERGMLCKFSATGSCVDHCESLSKNLSKSNVAPQFENPANRWWRLSGHHGRSLGHPYLITGWIKAHTGKGETLKSFELEPLKSHTTGAYATVAYRVHLTWTDKHGKDHFGALRIIHTWLHEVNKWQSFREWALRRTLTAIRLKDSLP